MAALEATFGSVDPVVHWIARLALGALFAAAALHKLRDRESFRSALGEYEILPAATIPAFASTLAALEGAVAIGLLLPVDSACGGISMNALAGLAAVGLLALYSGALSLALLRGRREIDCGCAGIVFDRSARHSIGWGLVARNLGLIATAGLCAASTQRRDLFWLDGVVAVLAAGSFALLYSAAERAMANAALEAR